MRSRERRAGCDFLGIRDWAGQRAAPCLLDFPAAGQPQRSFGPDLLRTGLHNRKPAQVCFVLLPSVADKAEG